MSLGFLGTLAWYLGRWGVESVRFTARPVWPLTECPDCLSVASPTSKMVVTMSLKSVVLWSGVVAVHSKSRRQNSLLSPFRRYHVPSYKPNHRY